MNLALPEFRSEQCIAYYIACIGSALHHLHRHNILHRDVKPENVLCDHHGRPILTDFGVAYYEPVTNVLPLCSSTSGTLTYLAPEVLTPCHLHSHQSDFWSLGVLMCEMLYGVRPFPTHCPRTFVYYSANTYTNMWTKLQSTTPEKGEVNWTDAFMNYPPAAPIPYPELDVTLLPDGSLCPALSVRIELDIARDMGDRPFNAAQVLSPAGDKFLCGLLDVRIEKRIGCNWKDFVSDKWFVDNGVNVSDVAHVEPYMSSELSMYNTMNRKFIAPAPVAFNHALIPRLSAAEQVLVDSYTLPVRWKGGVETLFTYRLIMSPLGAAALPFHSE